MGALERFINDDLPSPLDPLIKMALIHHQFETIHPFYDGNGRIGRILNVLYLTRTGLLDVPILYLSRHITRTKAEYYRRLQAVRTDGAWEEWVLYMLQAVAVTAHVTLRLVEGIRQQMADVKRRMRIEMPRLYSQDLLNNLFRHPYTRTAFVQDDLSVNRVTAAKYLDQLAQHGFVMKVRAGRKQLLHPHETRKSLRGGVGRIGPASPPPAGENRCYPKRTGARRAHRRDRWGLVGPGRLTVQQCPTCRALDQRSGQSWWSLSGDTKKLGLFWRQTLGHPHGCVEEAGDESGGCTSALTPGGSAESEEMRTPGDVLETRRLHGVGWGTQRIRRVPFRIRGRIGPQAFLASRSPRKPTFVEHGRGQHADIAFP